MFLSKIWFFLLALAAAVGLTLALVMPRPAQRAIVADEHDKLRSACQVIGVLLADDARKRVELAGTFARHKDIVDKLDQASGAASIDAKRMREARDKGEEIMKGIQGRTPDWAMLVDKRGRVVARIRYDQDDFGDVVAGRPLLDDALAGYVRDDLWAQGGTLYFVSAAPVVKRSATEGQNPYVGAVVLGHKVTNDLAKKLAAPLEVELGFHLGGDDVASSKTVALDHKPMQDAAGALPGNDLKLDCSAWDASKNHPPLTLRAGNETYDAVIARLPGEAQAKGAFYSVFVHPPDQLGFMGTLKNVKKGDLSFGGFPWILVGAGFLIVLGVGIGLMWVEADRPLRRLAADTVKLAKGETERLKEDEHGGKFGSIARSVNIHIDKLGREAKSAHKNLDQLLGPAPEGSLGTIDLLAGSLPARSGPAPATPPPSEFKFGDSTPPPTRPAAPPPRPATPPPVRATPPKGAPVVIPAAAAPVAAAPVAAPSAPPLRLDDDILGSDLGASLSGSTPAPTNGEGDNVDPYFKSVYDQFVSVKKSCNEPTTGLTYQKFADKLVKNRDDLIAKTGCREVRFTVYVKDGKAALKATPVKDEP